MSLNKIYIFGAPGSGKSYAAKKISKFLKINIFHLDDIYWDKKDKNYTIRNDEKKRDEQLKNIVQKKRWIIEGSYNEWTREAYENADIIIFLRPKQLLRNIRIIKRDILKRFGIIKGKRNKLNVLIDFIKWNYDWDKRDKKQIEEIMNLYNDKIHCFRKADDAIKYIKKMKN